MAANTNVVRSGSAVVSENVIIDLNYVMLLDGVIYNPLNSLYFLIGCVMCACSTLFFSCGFTADFFSGTSGIVFPSACHIPNCLIEILKSQRSSSAVIVSGTR